mmetsp:Transcript_5934/g.16123  ORF Transcript_5934/g.16123 Transcript_5934/m.16123 type:complete len:152 (-) Transcript_5934:254-709(-)
MPLSLEKTTPLHGIAFMLSAGSIFYTYGWISGMIDSSHLPGELFQGIGPKGNPTKTGDREANDVEKILYKNYVIGLLVTPAIALVTALQSGEAQVEQLGAITVATANCLYSLHLFTSIKSAFRKGMREAAATSHAVVGLICLWEAWKRGKK